MPIQVRLDGKVWYIQCFIIQRHNEWHRVIDRQYYDEVLVIRLLNLKSRFQKVTCRLLTFYKVRNKIYTVNAIYKLYMYIRNTYIYNICNIIYIFQIYAVREW